MVAPRKNSESGKPRRPPATTPEAREHQLIAMAFDAAEEQIQSGKASASTINHFLKLGTVKEQLEREKIRHEITLLESRASQIDAAEDYQKTAAAALAAFKSYQGEDPDDPENVQ